jgi:putative protease
VDFSKTKVSRSQIKAVSTSMIKGQPLNGVSRFNWKDGFYNPEKIEEYKAANERAAAAKAKGAAPVRKAPAKGKNSAKFNSRKKR